MQQEKLKTIVYVDGFNLYYGSLKRTNFKWLDLNLLFNYLLNKHDIIEIKYFTARVSARDNDPDAPNRQKAYLSAIERYIPQLKIYYGHYLTRAVKAKVFNPPKGCPPFVNIIKTEEKGSDVNIALHVLNDAWLNKYDCAVIVSNDGDLAEALRLVKSERGKKIGLILPDNSKRKPSRELSKYADFIKHTREKVLSLSQLPNPIPGTNIYKPTAW